MLLQSNPARADFKHKKSGQRLWINDSTPEWVLSKLDMLSFGQTPSSKKLFLVCSSQYIFRNLELFYNYHHYVYALLLYLSLSGSLNDPKNDAESLWHDLVGNPINWWDNREDKLKGSVIILIPFFFCIPRESSSFLLQIPLQDFLFLF